MHVAASDLRVVNGSGLVIRFAMLGDIAFVQADVPERGSAGTRLEEACRRPHWGLVLDGEVELERGRDHVQLRRATAFHVPAGGPAHRFRAAHGARIAAFDPVDRSIDLSESSLRTLGLEPMPGDDTPRPSLAPSADELAALGEGGVDAGAVVMGSLVLTRAHFGPKSGYATNPCQLAHWGMVTSGSVVLESGDGAEILGPGDVFACPSGAPGHRILAARPASLIDYTPLEEITHSSHVADWRREAFGAIRDRQRPSGRVGIANLLP